jgi:hypothetical protein
MGNIKIWVIGAGRWGKNHIRTLFELGAGVYLYQLQAKDFVKTRKMVLLK